jgi:hypothetical protein
VDNPAAEARVGRKLSQDETCGPGRRGCDAGMETVAALGALGVLIAVLNMVSLRVVRVDDVPVCVQSRIRWWSAHNPAFGAASLLVAVAGLIGVAVLG